MQPPNQRRPADDSGTRASSSNRKRGIQARIQFQFQSRERTGAASHQQCTRGAKESSSPLLSFNSVLKFQLSTCHDAIRRRRSSVCGLRLRFIIAATVASPPLQPRSCKDNARTRAPGHFPAPASEIQYIVRSSFQLLGRVRCAPC
jgi:hypothetical protein